MTRPRLARARLALPALLAAALATVASAADRYTDLLILAEHDQRVLSGERVAVGVWDLDDHYRPVLSQRTPGRSLLGPIAPAPGCRLRFGLGVPEDAWPSNPGVIYRVSLQRGEGETLLFHEVVGRTTGRDRAWRDRTIDVPGTEGEPFSLVFEARPVAGGDAGLVAGWSAPHLVCDGGGPPPKPARPNVILISLDTLRADHLGVYGYSGGTSPFLDAFAAESLVFDAAFTPAPWTLPAHASMFTGLRPDEHGGGHGAVSEPLPDGASTLAEVLADADYWTIAFTAGGVMAARNGLARGFQWWTERTRANLEHSLPGVFSAVGIPTGKPRFLFLHTYDIHGPYGYLPGLETRRTPDGDAPVVGPDDAEWSRIKSIPYHRYQLLDRFGGVAEAVAAYDAGIRFVDAQLGRLFARLKDVGMYDDSIIVVTSDHGESLYEHQLYLGHSYSLGDQELRVPLIVRFPDGKRRGRVGLPVSLVDVMPLVLGALGIEPPTGISGRDPLEASEHAPARIVRGEASHTGARYARSPTRKWIGAAYPADDRRSGVPMGLRDRFDGAEKLFDLTRDPLERNNLASSPKRAEFLPLIALGESADRPGARGTDTGGLAKGLSDAQRAELRALGYVE